MAILDGIFNDGREEPPSPLATPVEIEPEEVGEHLLSRIINMDSRMETHRHSGELVHVSSAIQGICPRREFLFRKHFSEIPMVPVKPADRIVWAMGRMAEEHCRSNYIEASRLDPEALPPYGNWECSRCGAEKKLSTYPQWKCCSSGKWLYREVTLVDAVSGITGNPDFLLQTGELEMHVVEFKSINKTGFDALVDDAQMSHQLQVAAYGRLLECLGYDVSGLTVVYVCKDYTFRNPYKSFSIDPDTKQGALDLIWEDAKVVRNMGTKVMPPRGAACKTPNSPVAKQCAACTLCFSFRDETAS